LTEQAPHDRRPPAGDVGLGGPSAPPAGRGRLRVAIALIVTFLYCQLFLVGQSKHWPQTLQTWMNGSRNVMNRLIHDLLLRAGVLHPAPKLGQGLFLVLVGIVVPVLAARLIMRTGFRGLGCRLPNRYGWRWLIAGYVVAAPFLVFMARGSGMAAQYLPDARRVGLCAFLSYYLVNMTAEHFLLHGFVLGAFRRDLRWPARRGPSPSDPSAPWWRRVLLCLGLSRGSRAPGQTRLTAWFQLAPGCGPAIVGSGVLFGLVHVGKDWREAVLSVPGGVALAILAYRSDSWYIPFLLHLATAGTTFALMLCWQQ